MQAQLHFEKEKVTVKPLTVAKVIKVQQYSSNVI